MAKTKPYQDELLRALEDPAEAAEYLNAALEEGDTETILLALRNVADAHGGVAKVAEEAGLNREHLYRMLSRQGNPELSSLTALLGALELRLAVSVRAGVSRSKPTRRARRP